MTTTEASNIKSNISAILERHARVSPAITWGILPYLDLQGKLYEAHVVSRIIETLVKKEGLRIELSKSGPLTLRQKGGPVDRRYCYFKVFKREEFLGELWTDIYFTTISYSIKSGDALASRSGPKFADFHELDIALIAPKIKDGTIPSYKDILLAVECKNTTVQKNVIRELLGYRRELSMLANGTNATHFEVWPLAEVNQVPKSVHMLFTTDKGISKYIDNCKLFGILLVHEGM